MTAPKRIQRKRTKGWKMPEGAVYVGRPTKWGNRFKVGTWARVNYAEEAVYNSARAVVLFRENARHWVLDLDQLRGKDLACWCALDQPCHADVLLEWANAGCDA